MQHRFWASSLAALLLLSWLTLCSPQTACADTWPEGPDVRSDSAIVMEVETGAILYEKNSHAKHYPASITKIMTTLLALENCELDETVVFSADAVFKNEGATSHIARDLNEEMTVEETLYAIMLESANECAWAMAEHVAAKTDGDVSDFVAMMNERASGLGCTDTHFNNPNGLPDHEHYTSAYDMALISCEAYKNDVFRVITGTKQYIIPPTNKHSEQTILNNHHRLLNYYKTDAYLNPYCTGGKTGYTDEANATLVTYAEKDGMKLCVVVMDVDEPYEFTDTNTLLDYCFSEFETCTIAEDERLQEARGLLNSHAGLLTAEEDAYIILPKDADTADLVCKAGIEDGNSVAQYFYEDHEVGTVVLQETKETVSMPSFGKNGNGLSRIRVPSRALLMAGLGLALVLALIFLFSRFRHGIAHYRRSRAAKKAYRERMRPLKARKRRERKKKKHR